jgi:signal transduction histidine kinase
VRTLARRAERAELVSSVLQPPVAAGEYVVLEVRDNGAGMDRETKERIFDPFFTTKEVGRGNGQGLAIARAIIAERHGGTITLDSERGTGTTFEIRLPVAGVGGTESALHAGAGTS